jgi:hypothetical protein
LIFVNVDYTCYERKEKQDQERSYSSCERLLESNLHVHQKCYKKRYKLRLCGKSITPTIDGDIGTQYSSQVCIYLSKDSSKFTLANMQCAAMFTVIVTHYKIRFTSFLFEFGVLRY